MRVTPFSLLLPLTLFLGVVGGPVPSAGAQGGAVSAPTKPAVKEDFKARLNRGVSYLNSSLYDQAIAEFTAIIDGAATVRDKKLLHDAYDNRALAYSKTRKYAEAVSDYGKLIAADPDDATAYFNRGIAHYNLGKTDKAAYAKVSLDLKAFKIRANPGDPNIEKADKIIAELATCPPGENLAIDSFTTAITSNPNDFNARFNRGVFYLIGKQYDQAIADFSVIIAKAAIVTDKELLHDAYYSRALAYSQMPAPRYVEAVADATQAVTLKPNDPDALITRADANFALKKFPHAVADYIAYLAIKPDDTYAIGKLTDSYLQQTPPDYATALASLDQRIARNPKQGEYLKIRGGINLSARNYAAAITDYNSYIARNPNDAAAYYNRGLANYYAKSYDPAIADLTQYITRVATAESAQGYLDRGNAYTAKKDYTNAVADYTKYTTIKPTEAVGFKSRGNVYLLMTPPRYLEARDDFTKVITLTPNDVDAQKVLLFIHPCDISAGSNKRLEMASSMLAKNPKDPEALSLRSQALMDQKDYAGAAADYTKLLMVKPNDPIALFNRGVAYYNLNQYDRAVADFTTYLATAKDPKDAKVGYEGRALSYMKSEKYTEAVADYDKVVAADPNDANAYFNRGIAYYNLSKTDRADNTALDRASSDLKAFKTRARAGNPNIEKADQALAEIALAYSNKKDK